MGLRLVWRKWVAKRNGRLDGKKGIPADEQEEHTPYEQTLIKEGDSAIHYVMAGWLHKDRRLKQQYCGALTTLENLVEGKGPWSPAMKTFALAAINREIEWTKCTRSY